MLQAKVFSASIPKFGNSDEENEDARYCVLIPRHKDGSFRQIRCAISDGATTASFSNKWANILVEKASKHKNNPSEILTKLILEEAGEQWQEEIDRLDLPWFAEEKVKKGSYATLLWLGINESKNMIYANLTAISIGDSELLLVRKNKIKKAFPIATSAEFNSSPFLAATKKDKNRGDYIKRMRMEIKPGDDILIATDAVACYLLRKFEEHTNPLTGLTFLPNSENSEFDKTAAFNEWITALRVEREIKNDDSTLIWFKILESK